MGPPASVPAEVWSTLTLPELIDYHLEHNPTQPWAIFPSATPGAEPEKITYLEFARATQRFARIVCAGGDVPVKRGEIVGILVHTDSLLYVSAVGGLMRGGFTVRCPVWAWRPYNDRSRTGLPHISTQLEGRNRAFVA
jgi:acyl-CoA synthetase (AMP-forming)/AMP-acid ligase II